LDSGSGTGRVGNNKGIKSVFSGHFRAPVATQERRMRSNRKAQLAKGDLRINGESCLCFLLDGLQRMN